MVAFTIRLRERNRVIGRAVICVDARYASVWWQGQPRADRRFLMPAHWNAIGLALDPTSPTAALDENGVVAGALVHDSLKGRYLIHYGPQESISDELTASDAVRALDHSLVDQG